MLRLAITFGIGLEIEYRCRNMAVVITIDKGLEKGGELQFPKARFPSIRIIDVHMFQIPATGGPPEDLPKRGLLACERPPAVKGDLMARVADLRTELEGMQEEQWC